MRLSAESHERVERFFRAHKGDPSLSLPPVFVHAGRFAGLLTKFAGTGAITLGRHVFVKPSLIERDERGRALFPSPLLVHEAAHILQFEERGYARFLRDYLRGYWRALRGGGVWNADGRMAAYLSIEEEREACEAEDAFVAAGCVYPCGPASVLDGQHRLTPFRGSKS